MNNDFIILEPFYEISSKYQAEIVVTASLVVPAIVHLITHFHDIKKNLTFSHRRYRTTKTRIRKIRRRACKYNET